MSKSSTSKIRAGSPLRMALVVLVAVVLFFVVKFVVGAVWKLLFYLVAAAVALGVAWLLVDRFLLSKR